MESSSTARLVSTSRVEMAQVVLPGDANPLGTAFGGRVVQWMDLAATIAARRHSGMSCVTVSIDQLTVLAPIHVGSVVNVTAQVNAVFGTSMEIGVDVEVEEPESGTRRKCCDAFLTFVALGPDGRPGRAPPLLLPQSEPEVERARAAEARRAQRLAARKPGR